MCKPNQVGASERLRDQQLKNSLEVILAIKLRRMGELERRAEEMRTELEAGLKTPDEVRQDFQEDWEAAGFKSPDQFRRGGDAFWTVVALGAVCVVVVLAMVVLWGLQKWGG